MKFLFPDSDGSSANSVGKACADALRELSQPCPPGDRVKAAINRAARICSLSYWRTFNLWYRKARRIDAHEAFQISEALRLKREKEARDEYQELRVRLARLESKLVQKDPDFHRADFDPLRSRLPRSR
jgi:hypothetical protein